MMDCTFTKLPFRTCAAHLRTISSSNVQNIFSPLKIKHKDSTWREQFFCSASAFLSSFYHCDLWMRKWKRNQILLSPSTINATFQDFANGWSAVLSHRSHQAIGTSIAITIYLKAPLTPYKNECRSEAAKVIDYKFKCVNFWRHFWIHNWDQSVGKNVSDLTKCYIHIPVLHIVTQKGQWL